MTNSFFVKSFFVFLAACTLILTACNNPSSKGTAIPVTGVHLEHSTLSLSVGGTETAVLVVSVLPADASNKEVRWESDNEHVATVDNSGKVSAIAQGTAIITVTTLDGGYTTTCTVSVGKNIAVYGVSFDKRSFTLPKGAVEKLTYTIEPSNATNKGVEFESDERLVAFVDGIGIVYADAVGTATITIKTLDGGHTDTCNVIVTSPVDVTGISLNTASLVMNVGEAATLVATVEPASASFKNVIWESNNPSVAYINSSGIVTAIATGTATITVSTHDRKYSTTCSVVVN